MSCWVNRKASLAIRLRRFLSTAGLMRPLTETAKRGLWAVLGAIYTVIKSFRANNL